MSSFFHLTSNERRGVLGALILMIFIVAFKLSNNQLDQAYIIAAEVEIEIREDSLTTFSPVISKYSASPEILEQKKTIKLFPKKINPNSVSHEEWAELGIPLEVSLRIYKYIRLQNGINKPSDLLAVYGFQEDWLTQLKDSLDFTIEKVDIQTASEGELKSIKGIGDIYAKRIIKYKKLLGGYISVDQLIEVYGIDSVLLNSIGNNIMCSAKDVLFIDVNTCGYNELKRHPYISDEEAMSIIQVRSGSVKLTVDDVKNKFSQKSWIQIKNYLK